MTSPGELTDGQREEAQRLVYPWASTHIHEMSDEHQATIERVAIALVAGKERARAPFLELAKDWERQVGLVTGNNDLLVSIAATTLTNIVVEIRRAAEEAS